MKAARWYHSDVECKKRDRLSNNYERALVEASMAKVTLSRVAGEATLADQADVLRELSRAEARTNKAHSAYEQHIIEHGCAPTI